MTASLHAIPLKIVAAALAAVVLTAGQAAARNHDCQSFRLPSVLVFHDHAPGPTVR